jgi:phage portal protein BeeE
MGTLARLLGRESVGSVDAQILEAVAARLDHLDPWTLPVVVAGRMLIADTVATMPIVAVRGAERVSPTPALLKRPDPREPVRLTLERIVNNLTRHGVAWWRVYDYGSDGYPLAIRVVDSHRVQYQLSAAGDEVAEVWVDGIRAPLRGPGSMRYLSFITDDDGPIGTSPLLEIRTALEQLATVYRFSAEYYDYGAAVPPYAIKHPTRQTATQAEAFMAQWTAARAQRRPAFLSGGVELETFSPQSAADALLTDAINYLDSVAGRVLLIPPSLLNLVSSGSLTYSTTDAEFRRWLQLGLYPGYLSRIAAAFTDMLPRGVEAVFDTSNLVRMDFGARISTYAQSINAGIHTPTEARALEGLPAIPAAVPVPVSPNVEGI